MSRTAVVLLGLFVFIMAVYLFFRWQAKPATDVPFFAGSGEALAIAHQGGERLYPSETMFAFDQAVAMGVDVLEMDVHSTADGVLVLMHDATVDRTTDGRGVIKEMSFAEMQQLDAGYYWTDDDGQTYPYRGQGITVPALEELFQTYPDMLMNIELKQQEPSIVRPFCDLVHEYEMQDKVLMATFHPDVMEEFRQTCPDVATSMVQKEIFPLWLLSKVGLEELYTPAGEAIQAPLTTTLPVLGEVDILTESFIEDAHRRNVQVHAWTIDDPVEMERLLEKEIDGIITDRPDLLLGVLNR